MHNRLAATILTGTLCLPSTIAMQRPSTVVVGPAPLRADTVSGTASMTAARAAHTATALLDGDVLVVGGFTGQEGDLAGTELYDQRRERFERIVGSGVLRQSHTATRLRDGRVLVAGGLGERNQYLGTAELYDPATRTFSMTGPMSMARSGHEAVMLADGRVLLVGGVGTGWTFLASAELYDPATGSFTAADDMSEPREGHAAVRLRDGRVLVTGGHRGRGSATVVSRTAEIFDPATGRFSGTGSMARRRHKHDAVTIEDGRVLVLGGADERDQNGVYDDVEVFDPARGAFRAGRPMHTGRYKFRGTSLPMTDGGLLLAGGAAQAERYDPATGDGELVGGADHLTGQFSAAAPLPRGRVLITGGYGRGRGPGADAWVFHSSSGSGAPIQR